MIKIVYINLSIRHSVLVAVMVYMISFGEVYGQPAKLYPFKSQAPVIVDSTFSTTMVNDKILVYPYKSGKNPGFENLIKKLPEGFSINTDNTNVMIGRAYEYPGAWLYLPVKNNTIFEKKMVVDVEHNRCDTLEVFLLNSGDGRSQYLGKLYRNIPLANRTIPVRAFALPFNLAAQSNVGILLHSKRVIGIHELNVSLSTEKYFTIKSNEQDLIRLFALSSAFFFVFAVLSLGLIFEHQLLVRFGIYIFPVAVGQLNFNYFFDQITFPSIFSLNANTVGIFIIFATNSLFFTFGTAYIKSLNLFRRWHRVVNSLLISANVVQMLLLLFPISALSNRIITDASLILSTINIFWLFYISILGFLKKGEKYLLITATLVFVPILYKTYILNTPALNFNYFQPIYFLILFGYLIVSLFRKELTSRQLAEEKIRQVQDQLEAVRKNEIEQIGRNLHDQLGNTLASALGYLSMKVPNVVVANKMILDAINETRVISHNLVKDDDRPVDEKLEDITDRFNDFSTISFDYKDYTEERINQLTLLKQQNIYMIVQEVLNNIVKHSQAKEVTIQVFLIDEMIRVSIEDDGIGSTESQQTGGIGIQNMYKRAALANLDLTIDAGISGTSVTIEAKLGN